MTVAWQPTASIETLRRRADIIGRIRTFFAERNVLEVETPILSHATVTDLHIQSIEAPFKERGATQEEICYLQTSPEYAMKRLLAAGAGSIFQITKSFRQGDIGRLHNPEFSLLEWYRPGFDHHALMDELDELLQVVLEVSPATRRSATQVYQDYVGLNPHTATTEELKICAEQRMSWLPDIPYEKNTYLDLLFTHFIEPYLGQEAPFLLYDFPISQAALAKIRLDNPPVASRFEMYFKGVELANGFHELQDATEQRKRFEKELIYRKKNSMSLVPLDERFLAALEYGIPDCAGVAVGIDRLIMLALGDKDIASIMSFSFSGA
ncbi:MAG: epmA [Gammaproteobacteria bacterium]|jgi:lysyl-tRNA synthetase class 2|nr:epmA [Gammaproteobacteria bacterium]